jgi:hypothetical protein
MINIQIMQVVIVALAAVVLGVGILSTNPTKTSDDELSASETLVVENSVLAEETEELEPTASPEPTREPTQQPSPIYNSTVTTTPPSSAATTSLSSYVYPGSSIVSSRDNYLELQSNANTNTVTDWYRSLLKSNSFSINSAIKTTTNGVVSNKLVGSDGDTTIEVNISQDNSSAVLITVRKS